MKKYFFYKAIKIKRLISLFFVKRVFKDISDVDFSPVFIIGTNRSGTSITSSLLSQHPQLEGLFHGNITNKMGTNGHSIGFCESSHIWSFLEDTNSDFYTRSNEGALWGHPKHISKYYMDGNSKIFSSVILANLIQKFRKTKLDPLIKDQWNMLRIGFIKKYIPSARFILVYRDYEKYIKSCSHKWQQDKIHISTPNIGLHWLNLNNTAIFDLKKFASNEHAIIAYNDLFNDEEKVQCILNEALKKIGINSFQFDLSVIDSNAQFAKNNIRSNTHDNFSNINNIFNYEKNLKGNK
ncbi:sulfotransferase [Halobacteriovorax sp. HLS]|uniref:sulfotransferase n=1 Tax=Halobacteriovorax sp. HLS TaxID=2234000 RepID=UPI000FD8F845|nr:sulfotransferase [Halobacteriovorax sp. HLS]